MTTITPPRLELCRGVVAAIVSVGVRADIGVAPELEREDEGYAIVYLISGQPTHMDMKDVTHVLRQVQITNVGHNIEQALWVADKTCAAMLQRNPIGDHTTPITASDARVIDRRLSLEGEPEPAGGGLWQIPDTYDMEVVPR